MKHIIKKILLDNSKTYSYMFGYEFFKKNCTL